nr:gustatory receptor 9 [Podabrus annulatus]
MKPSCTNPLFYIQKLCEYGKIFGLTPPFDLNGKPILIKKHRTIVALEVIVIATLWFLSLWDRITTCYPAYPNSVIVTDVALVLVLFLTNMSSMILPSFNYTTSFNRFLKLYYEYDKLISLIHFHNPVRNVTHFYRELIIGHLIIIFFFIFDAFIWLNVFSAKFYTCYILRLFMFYLAFVMVQIIRNFILSLNSRFKTINNALQDSFLKFPRENVIKRVSQLTMFNPKDDIIINVILHMYDKVLDQIGLFNVIFGRQIFLLFGTIFFSLIDSINYLYWLSVASGFNGKKSMNIIFVTSLWSLVYLFMGILVVRACSETTEEIEKTSKICEKVLINLPIESSNQKLVDQLNLLTHIVNQDSKNFTAAGFFNISYSMLLTLFSSVTSYIIVVIQMSQ